MCRTEGYEIRQSAQAFLFIEIRNKVEVQIWYLYQEKLKTGVLKVYEYCEERPERIQTSQFRRAFDVNSSKSKCD